ncbi:MAG: hypothetical protein GX759_00190 [Thermoanaerobacterales bacterium]|jgi:hypothetical protein|nr:hypothetical protein [Thermoanaerobacterales bacterium]
MKGFTCYWLNKPINKLTIELLKNIVGKERIHADGEVLRLLKGLTSIKASCILKVARNWKRILKLVL